MHALLEGAVEACGLGRYLPPSRQRLARKYLKGEGLEIGALHDPLRVGPQAVVRYVDIATRAENIVKFPELKPEAIVNTDYVTNGFTLEAVADASQDFLIANQVLEHAPNPLAVMAHWLRVLKLGGTLYLGLPLVQNYFDRGREVTTLAHIIGDQEAFQRGGAEALRARNREHYREWLTVSEPNIFRERGTPRPPLSEAELAAKIDELAAGDVEIHFHTFSLPSISALLEHCISQLRPGGSLLEIADVRGVAIAVLRV